MTPTETARAKISKARATLILSSPFFAALALRLDVRPIPPGTMGCDTIGVDGRNLWFCPEWINEQKPEHLVSIVAHEAMHMALNHMTRRQGRDPARWNQACDHPINLILKAAGMPLPKSGLQDPRFADMSAEQVYPLIPEQPPAEGGNYGGMGCVLDATGDDGKPLSEPDREAMEREWKIALIQAAQSAKAQGKLPAGLEALIDSVRAPSVDWRAVLREFVRSAAANDYSWRKGNYRHLADGNWFPSLYDETVGPIAMGVDTSGSVSQDELNIVCDELNGCLDNARPESVHVLYCDAKVHGHEVFKPDDWPVRMNVQGRGGTDLRGLWGYMVAHDIDPVCAIVTTDMELRVEDLGEEPYFPCLFLSTGRDHPMDGPLPFGTLVKVEAVP